MEKALKILKYFQTTKNKIIKSATTTNESKKKQKYIGIIRVCINGLIKRKKI